MTTDHDPSEFTQRDGSIGTASPLTPARLRELILESQQRAAITEADARRLLKDLDAGLALEAVFKSFIKTGRRRRRQVAGALRATPRLRAPRRRGRRSDSKPPCDGRTGA
jgi:hypothetical protein